jgi:hypothetical protein
MLSTRRKRLGAQPADYSRRKIRPQLWLSSDMLVMFNNQLSRKINPDL